MLLPCVRERLHPVGPFPHLSPYHQDARLTLNPLCSFISSFGLTYNLILPSPDRLPRYLIQDASQPLSASRRRARFRPITSFYDVLTKLARETAAEYTSLKESDQVKKTAAKYMPPVMVLGAEEGVVCEVDVLKGVMGRLHREVLGRM
jgi:hypothetical protein